MNFCSRIYNQTSTDYYLAEKNRRHIKTLSGDANRSPNKSGNLKATTKDWVVKSFYSSSTVVAAAKKKSASVAPIPTANDQTKNPPAKNIPDYRGEPEIYFDQSVIDSNAEKFKFCLVGKFKRSRPSLEKIREWVAKEWKPKGEWSVTLLDQTHVFIRLDNEGDMIRIWPRNRWFIRGHLMKIFKWAPIFRPSDGEPSSSAVWISLPLLPVVFFQQELLHSIAALVGRVIAMDGPTRNLSRTNVARVCVEVDLLRELPKRVWIGAGGGGFWQEVRYEKLPSYCTGCRELGHSLRICKFSKPDASSCVSKWNSNSKIGELEKKHLGADILSQPSNTHCSFVEEKKNKGREATKSIGECSNVLGTKETHSASGPNKISRRGISRSWHTVVVLGTPKKQTSERRGIRVLDEVEGSMGIGAEKVISDDELSWNCTGLLDEGNEVETEIEEAGEDLPKKELEIHCPDDQKQQEQHSLELMKNIVDKGNLRKRYPPSRDNFLLKHKILFWKRKPAAISTASVPESSSSHCSSLLVNFPRNMSFPELKLATKNFDQSLLIGYGGFGRVYKGVLSVGITVAIKRRNKSSQQGAHQFKTEIMMLSKIRHKHLVCLIGFCQTKNEMILVYEFMANGTLGGCLYNSNKPPLSWKQRLKICIGAARGLHFLHTRGIIHRDVKTSNILMDSEWDAKISDFGLSMLGPNLDQTHVSTLAMGTLGYLDPQYFYTGRMTYKSDVYSLGVVLLEVLCGRPPIKNDLPEDEVNLVVWALHYQSKGNLDDIIDPCLRGEINPKCLEKFGEIAGKCLSLTNDRPEMEDVLSSLEFALQLQESILVTEVNF